MLSVQEEAKILSRQCLKDLAREMKDNPKFCDFINKQRRRTYEKEPKP
jgi:hypothetical protein